MVAVIREGNTSRTWHDPERTCVGCRRRAPRSHLSRMIYDPVANAVCADPRGHASGRGAWVHPTGECLQRALHPTVLARALRISPHTTVTINVSEVERYTSLDEDGHSSTQGACCG